MNDMNKNKKIGNNVGAYGMFILLTFGCGFLGLIAGQFLAMPFLLFIRSDPGVPAFDPALITGYPLFRMIGNGLPGYFAAMGIFAGGFINRGRIKTFFPATIFLFVLACFIFAPGPRSAYYDQAAWQDARSFAAGFLLGGIMAGLVFSVAIIKKR